MRCLDCGHENPDHSVYCGKCGHEIGAPPSEKSSWETHPRANRHGFDEGTKVGPQADFTHDSIVSIAVNVRRIFLVLALGLVVTLSVYVLSFIMSYWDNRNLDFERARALMTAWYAALTLVIALGLYYIVKYKRITKP